MPDDPQRPSPFADILRARYSRRLVLAGLGAGAGAAAMALLAPPGAGEIAGESTLRFANANQAVTAGHAVAPGYRVQVLIRWGDPVLADAPAFTPAAQTAAAQARQFGYNNDFVAFVPERGAPASPDRGLLCVNHEYVNTNLMRSGVTSYEAGVK